MVMLAACLQVMEKLDEQVTIAFKRPADASLPWFRGDESDLEEMAGDLLDDACKWSAGKIAVTMSRPGRARLRRLFLVDAGASRMTVQGLTEEGGAQKVLHRGVRLDETPRQRAQMISSKELVACMAAHCD